MRITGPTGTLHQPWVMPFVGDWTNAKLSAAATTGVNNTENVERVDHPLPMVPGVYTATVSFTGSGFQLGVNVKLTKTGQSDFMASAQEIRPDDAKFRINVNGMAAGQWKVFLTNPDGQTSILPNSFSIAGALWQDNIPLTIEVLTDGPTQTVRALDDLSEGNPARRFMRLLFEKRAGQNGP